MQGGVEHRPKVASRAGLLSQLSQGSLLGKLVPLDAQEVTVVDTAVGEHIEGPGRTSRARDLADVVGVTEVPEQLDL